MKKIRKWFTTLLTISCLIISQSFGAMAQEAGDGIQSVPGTETAQPGAPDQPDEQPGDQPKEQPDEEAAWIEEANSALSEITAKRTVMALVYLSDEYPIRSEALETSGIVVTVPSGQQVQIQKVTLDGNYQAWVYVKLLYEENAYEGYIPRSYLACSDELFLEWEAAYNMNPKARLLSARNGTYADVELFPDSYKAALNGLKNAHPNWTFVKMNTKLDWNTVVTAEVGAKSLVPSSFPAYMQDGIYSPGWAYATRSTLEYYLDPRNGINEDTIFQFEQLTYNASYHTEAAVQGFLKNTFMTGVNAPGTVLTFEHIFWAIGAELKVSPFHLACRVYQEQGKGTSPLISGTYKGYEGYYNYFNIGASGTTNQAVIESGLQRAKQENWYNAYFSILGGAKVISDNYILKGQDNLYLQKFDVDDSFNGLYWHQYMQNICAPSSEAQNIRKLYQGAGSLENTFVFKIPVYENMPASACPKPTASYSVSLTPPAGYTDTTVYVDGLAYPAESRNGSYVVTVPDGNARTAVLYKYNASNVPVGMYVWNLSHDGKVYTAAPVPELENLLTYHGFSIRITGKSGIRFKTGISSDLRKALTSTGVAGYTLKEYGTLVMNNANRTQYPMIKGGQKVLGGMAYGRGADGAMQDMIYETVDGRYRFTSVLVGLPANQYKTDYAFRGYAVLTKNGTDVTLYGPIVWRSIYSLAAQVIAGGQYEQGSSADLFLRQLIADADKAGT